MADPTLASDVGGIVLAIGGIILTIGIRWYLFNQRDKKFLVPMMTLAVAEMAIGAIISFTA